jgi:hypothetical protein
MVKYLVQNSEIRNESGAEPDLVGLNESVGCPAKMKDPTSHQDGRNRVRMGGAYAAERNMPSK